MDLRACDLLVLNQAFAFGQSCRLKEPGLAQVVRRNGNMAQIVERDSEGAKIDTKARQAHR